MAKVLLIEGPAIGQVCEVDGDRVYCEKCPEGWHLHPLEENGAK